MICPGCRATNADNAAVCEYCGTSLAVEAPVQARAVINAGPGTGKTWTIINCALPTTSTAISKTICGSHICAMISAMRSSMAAATLFWAYHLFYINKRNLLYYHNLIYLSLLS